MRLSVRPVMVFWVFALGAVSLGLRLYSIGKQSYWIDEMVSLNIAKSGSWTAVKWDNSPFLYHWLLQNWVSIFGDNEMAVRSLSAIFSALATVIMGVLGFQIDGRRGAVFAGLLHSLSSLSIQMGQEARMYSLFEFGTALNLLCFYQFLFKNRHGLLFLATIPLLFVTHYLGSAPVILEAFWLVLLGRSRQSRVYGAAILSTLSLGLVLAFSLGVNVRFLNWQILKFQVEPDSRWPLEIMSFLVNRSVWVGLGLVLLIGLWVTAKRRTLGEMAKDPAAVFLSFLVLPLIAATVLTGATGRAMLIPRYFIFTVPFFVGGVAWIWSEVQANQIRFRFRTWVKWAAGALIILGTLVELPQNFRIRKAPWRETARTIYQAGDRVAITDKTLAMRVPYFDELGIELFRWPSSDHSLAFVIEILKKTPAVWVIEDYWGGKDYLPKLKRQLDDQGFKTQDHVFQIEESPPVLALKVTRLGEP